MAKDGMTLCLGQLTITFLVWGLWLFDGRDITLAAATVSSLLCVFFFYFFRDPKRIIPNVENALVSPADGKVVAIKNIGRHNYLKTDSVQISIFLSPLDVHINRVPISGTIDFVNYQKGKFLAAYNDLASEQNEQTEIGLSASNGSKVVFKQIAGWMARRIVCHLQKGQKVSAGEKFGMIKFGSRTDLIIAADAQIEIKLGQQVKGGETIIARNRSTNVNQSVSVSSKQNDA